MRVHAWRLTVWTRFFDPVERVWEVKTDPAVLRAEFPWYARFSVDDPERLRRSLSTGAPCVLRGRLGPGFRWPVDLDLVEPGVRFRDRSENALYRRFEHEHLFEPAADGARYVDRVTFEPALPLPRLVAVLTERLFVRRHRVAARHLNPDRRTIGTSALRRIGSELLED